MQLLVQTLNEARERDPYGLSVVVQYPRAPSRRVKFRCIRRQFTNFLTKFPNFRRYVFQSYRFGRVLVHLGDLGGRGCGDGFEVVRHEGHAPFRRRRGSRDGPRGRLLHRFRGLFQNGGAALSHLVNDFLRVRLDRFEVVRHIRHGAISHRRGRDYGRSSFLKGFRTLFQGINRPFGCLFEGIQRLVYRKCTCSKIDLILLRDDGIGGFLEGPA
mmetsp:Transcript_2722/g.3580  ORF Transcript_2722/g.3580 Transcript_2722/m.3580 type:complete len:214 (-) Transcript_2722:832-1473(-)